MERYTAIQKNKKALEKFKNNQESKEKLQKKYEKTNNGK